MFGELSCVIWAVIKVLWLELWCKFYVLQCDLSCVWSDLLYICDERRRNTVLIFGAFCDDKDVFHDENGHVLWWKNASVEDTCAKCDDVWSKIWWHVARFEMIHVVGPVKDTWQTPHHQLAWQMPRHPLRGKSHVICQIIRCHIICHMAYATSPAMSSASVSPQAMSAPGMVHATWHFL